MHCTMSVSYTHLTLPTNREVFALEVGAKLTQKNKDESNSKRGDITKDIAYESTQVSE